MTTEDNYKYLAKDSSCDKTAVAKGAYKMGMYDSSDRYLKECLNVRNRSANIDGARSNIRIVLPIVKLKTE